MIEPLEDKNIIIKVLDFLNVWRNHKAPPLFLLENNSNSSSNNNNKELDNLRP